MKNSTETLPVRSPKKKDRATLLARRDKSGLQYGDGASSVKSFRNLLYLSNKGVITTFNPSVREATAITNSNIARAARVKNLRETREGLAIAHRQTIAKSLNR